MSEVEFFEGHPQRSQGYALEALGLVEETAGPLDLVSTLVTVALACAYAGETERAMSYADRALGLAEVSGSPLTLAWATYGAGEVRLETEPDRALEFLARSQHASHLVGERLVAGVAALSSLTLRSRLGRVDDLHEYGDLIEHWRQLGAWTLQWTTLRNLVEVLARRGQDVVASRLLGASRSSSRASPSYGNEAVRLKGAAGDLRRRLGERFETDLEAG